MSRTFNYMSATGRSRDDFREAMSQLAGVYAESAALLTADWYERQNPDSKYSAQADDDLAEEKLDAIAKWVFDGPQRPESRARVAAHRLVFDAARRTVFVNATEERVGIARHESAGSCDDCMRSSSLTTRDVSSGSEDVNQDFHPKCEGLFVPVRTGLWTPPSHASDWQSRQT